LLFLLLGNGGVWATDYKKITDDSGLEVGKKYLIVYENGTTGYVMGGVSSSYMGFVQSTIQDGVLTLPENVNIITLGGDKAGYTLKTSLSDGYLYYKGSGTNLGTNTTIDNKTKWTITFDNGLAHICNVGKNDRYVKNYTSNHTFRCYQTSNGEWVTLYKEVDNVTSIKADDVTYAADITSGEISYTINNPVLGTVPTATSSTAWIKNVVTITGQNKVIFDMSENTETTPRTGTITLKYGDAPEKIVNVTQLAAVAKRTVTIETPENGTLKVYRGEDEVTSGSLIPQGTELRVEATANEGYKFRNWQAVDGSTHTYTSTFTYTVGESDVTFKANFDEIVYHTITWSVNGVETTTNVEDGTDITFDTPTENIPEGYVFKGWYGSTYGPLDVAPEYVTSATATADFTYYAVFAKSNGGGTETATLTANHTSATSGYNDETYNDDKGNVWTGNTTEQITNNIARIQLKSTSGSYLESPEFPGNVTGIVLDAYNSNSSSRIYYIDSKKDNKTGDLGTATVDGNDKHGKEYTVVLKDKPFNKFFINVSGALGFHYIKVTYSSEVFTDFRTSVTAPSTVTITIAEACTDGNGMYYGTYSNSKAFVVPSDIIVSEISVIDNKLVVENYETGAVVPANTGVMVSSNTAGNHDVELSEAAGTSVLGNDNMLRPTSDNGITAEEMAANDANCKYYRLTMHKGTTLGFFYGAADGAAFKVDANKAYLAVPAEVAAKVSSFVIGGGSTTAIDGIEAGNGANANRKVYNLQGQRVSGTLPKGLYIIDGRKVIVK